MSRRAAVNDDLCKSVAPSKDSGLRSRCGADIQLCNKAILREVGWSLYMRKRKRKHDQTPPPAGVHQSATIENHSHAEEKFESLHAARLHILNLFARIDHLNDVIDNAFERRLFLPHLAPDAPANRHRFNAYFGQRRQVFKLFCRACELWRNSFGVETEGEVATLLVEEMRQKQSRAAGETKS
jgi:hypothetical protein